MNQRKTTRLSRALLAMLIGALMLVLPLASVSANDFADYGRSGNDCW